MTNTRVIRQMCLQQKIHLTLREPNPYCIIPTSCFHLPSPGLCRSHHMTVMLPRGVSCYDRVTPHSLKTVNRNIETRCI